MNPQAEELNETIKNNNSAVYDLLSEKGKAIFFPKKGILSQAAKAKGKKKRGRGRPKNVEELQPKIRRRKRLPPKKKR